MIFTCCKLLLIGLIDWPCTAAMSVSVSALIDAQLAKLVLWKEHEQVTKTRIELNFLANGNHVRRQQAEHHAGMKNTVQAGKQFQLLYKELRPPTTLLPLLTKNHNTPGTLGQQSGTAPGCIPPPSVPGSAHSPGPARPP